MKVVSYTEARNGLKAVLDNVVDAAGCNIITRRDAEDDNMLTVISCRYHY